MNLLILDPKRDNWVFYSKALSNKFQIQFQDKPQSQDKVIDSLPSLILMETRFESSYNFDYAQSLMKSYPDIPLIFISDPISEDKIIKAYEIGAVDYLTRPISLEMLNVRIATKIKSIRSNVSFDGLIFNPENQSVMLDNKKIYLTGIETKLLKILFDNPNVIFSRKKIQKIVWNNVHVQNQNIDTHISNLRKKLFPFSKRIKTVKYLGYIFNTCP
jgi:DNA-binding response OmpR family regulator